MLQARRGPRAKAQRFFTQTARVCNRHQLAGHMPQGRAGGFRLSVRQGVTSLGASSTWKGKPPNLGINSLMHRKLTPPTHAPTTDYLPSGILTEARKFQNVKEFFKCLGEIPNKDPGTFLLLPYVILFPLSDE